MPGTWGIGGMLYSVNVAKHSGEYPQTFRGMSSNIPGYVFKHSKEYHQTFRGMLPSIPGNAVKHAGECRQTFQGMSPMFGVNKENC